ncbi:hypothetical protein TNCV_3037041 [Trichonephila clavipes]|nr:hypothetical protein TNCV_3037041 [Trichonephila clavipes]
MLARRVVNRILQRHYGRGRLRSIADRVAAIAEWYISNRGLPCHEFEPSTTKDSPYREAMHVKSVESSNILLLVRTISIVYGKETWDQQILNKLHNIHPSTSHWAALPVRRHDVRLTRLRIGHTRFTHRHLPLVSMVANTRSELSVSSSGFHYNMTFGDGPRNSETWSSYKDDTSPNFNTTPTGRLLSLDILNVHRPLMHSGCSTA